MKKRSKLEVRKNFFSQTVVSKWNELPAIVLKAESVNCFKNRYDRAISSKENKLRNRLVIS